jgi:hypothetical protein
MKKALLLSLGFVLIAAIGFSQTNKYWSAHNDMSGKITTDKAVARQSFPKMFKLFDLNTNLLSQDLFSIVGKQTSKHSTIMSMVVLNNLKFLKHLTLSQLYKLCSHQLELILGKVLQTNIQL